MVLYDRSIFSPHRMSHVVTFGVSGRRAKTSRNEKDPTGCRFAILRDYVNISIKREYL